MVSDDVDPGPPRSSLVLSSRHRLTLRHRAAPYRLVRTQCTSAGVVIATTRHAVLSRGSARPGTSGRLNRDSAPCLHEGKRHSPAAGILEVALRLLLEAIQCFDTYEGLERLSQGGTELKR